MRFNPPPNWPVPPGWTPGPNWTPDPSWDPPPPGWQFWVDDSAAATSYAPSVPPQYPASGGQWAPGPPAYYGRPPSNKSRNILIAVGVCVVVIIAVVLTLVFALGGSGSDEDQIRGVIRGMESAWNKKDYEALKNSYCKKDQSKMTKDKFNSAVSSRGNVTFKVTKVTVHGDTADADVDVTYSKSSKTGSETLHFKKEDGSWKDCKS